MDYEALKDQWSEIEDRDGIRLSWNTFPSSRMVMVNLCSSLSFAHVSLGSVPSCRPHRSPIYALEGEA